MSMLSVDILRCYGSKGKLRDVGKHCYEKIRTLSSMISPGGEHSRDIEWLKASDVRWSDNDLNGGAISMDSTVLYAV